MNRRRAFPPPGGRSEHTCWRERGGKLSRKEPTEEPSPYRIERLQIKQLAESDPKAAIDALVSLRRRIEDDIERERRSAHAILANQLVQADPRRVRKLVKAFVENWVDIPARLYLFGDEDPNPYINALDDCLVPREAPIWEVVAPALGGDEAIQVIVSGRVSHWKAKALKLARDAVESKSSPKALIDAFMKRATVPSYDGKGGFTERWPVIGRDTLFAVRDETRWVSKTSYKKLAEIIGCIPEQLHPRDLPPPHRKRKR
jgi:hypothetical protein